VSRSDPHFKASCPLPPMTTIQVISMASFNKLSQVLSGGRHRLACVVQSLHSMAFKAYTQWLSRAFPGLPHCDTLRRALRSRTPRPFPTQALPSRQPLLMPGEVAAADQRRLTFRHGYHRRRWRALPPHLAYVAAQRWPRLQHPSARRRVGSDIARRPMGEQCPPMPGRQVAAAARDPTHGGARRLLDARAAPRARAPDACGRVARVRRPASAALARACSEVSSPPPYPVHPVLGFMSGCSPTAEGFLRALPHS